VTDIKETEGLFRCFPQVVGTLEDHDGVSDEEGHDEEPYHDSTHLIPPVHLGGQEEEEEEDRGGRRDFSSVGLDPEISVILACDISMEVVVLVPHY